MEEYSLIGIREHEKKKKIEKSAKRRNVILFYCSYSVEILENMKVENIKLR